MFDRCKWRNEPAQWELTPVGLAVVTDRATDFWAKTHYGFTRHSGHLFGYTTTGGFTASLRIRGKYESLYDQAGLMVLIDDETWIKAGVEISDGEWMFSSVLTVGCSIAILELQKAGDVAPYHAHVGPEHVALDLVVVIELLGVKHRLDHGLGIPSVAVLILAQLAQNRYPASIKSIG